MTGVGDEMTVTKGRRRLMCVVGSVLLLLGCLVGASGQYRRTPRVYRPGAYNRTRALMNRRAALRKARKDRLKAKAARRGHAHTNHH